MKLRYYFKNVKFILLEVWLLYVLLRVVIVIIVIYVRVMVWREIRKIIIWFFIIKKLNFIFWKFYSL